jgi:hypothetical protein
MISCLGCRSAEQEGAQNTVRWTDWLRTTLGWRGDFYEATVNSIFDANNSGYTSAAIGSPKFTMVVGPFNKIEFFFGAGTGMHSNDARGATITEEPTDPSMKVTASPLVRTEGGEVGIRTGAGFIGECVHSRSGLRNRVQRRLR